VEWCEVGNKANEVVYSGAFEGGKGDLLVSPRFQPRAVVLKPWVIATKVAI